MGKKVVVHIEGDHADWRHGNCANHARRAVREGGVEKAFREPSGNIHLIASSRYGDGCYDQVCQVRNGHLVEVTAFQPKDGILVSIIKWLFGKKARQISLDELDQYS